MKHNSPTATDRAQTASGAGALPCTHCEPSRRRAILLWWAASVGLLVAPVRAQTLSSPLGAAPLGEPLPGGSGAGVHSPDSPFQPLKPRSDVLPWSVLTDVQTRLDKLRLVPVYPVAVSALHRTKVRLQGFMMPLDPGQRQRHFLLASVPLSCSFCTPGGPESMVEVRARRPVTYRDQAVVVEGIFQVLQSDPTGLYYRLTEAVAVD